MRDVYDKYGHNNLEEDIVMAIDTYQRMLNTQMYGSIIYYNDNDNVTINCRDEPRRLVITNKLALMYNEMKKTEQVIIYYEPPFTLANV